MCIPQNNNCLSYCHRLSLILIIKVLFWSIYEVLFEQHLLCSCGTKYQSLIKIPFVNPTATSYSQTYSPNQLKMACLY